LKCTENFATLKKRYGEHKLEGIFEGFNFLKSYSKVLAVRCSLVLVESGLDRRNAKARLKKTISKSTKIHFFIPFRRKTEIRAACS
jgi:hypothetical protein